MSGTDGTHPTRGQGYGRLARSAGSRGGPGRGRRWLCAAGGGAGGGVEKPAPFAAAAARLTEGELLPLLGRVRRQ